MSIQLDVAHAPIFTGAKPRLKGSPTQNPDAPQYISNSVSYVASWIDPVPPPSPITDASMAPEIERANAVNGWTNTANTQYIMLPQSGSTYSVSIGAPGSWCAYHRWTSDNTGTYIFSIVGFVTDSGFQGRCSPSDSTAHDMTWTAAHEFFETETDPLDSGWVTTNGLEGGDLCQGDGAGGLLGEVVPYLWSNANEPGGCVYSYGGGATWHNVQNLTPPPPLGGIGGRAQPVSSAAGIIDVFWRGTTDNKLYHDWFKNGWNGPQNLSGSLGNLNSDPQPVSPSAYVLDVFWRGSDNNLWHAWYINGWNGPQQLDSAGNMASAPRAAATGGGNLEVFWLGADKALWHMYFNTGGPQPGWNGPQSLGGGPLGSAPHPVSATAGQVDVFWKGTDGGLWHMWYVTSWNGPASLGGAPLESDPWPVSSSPGDIDVFWRGSDNGLWEVYYANGWSSFQGRGGAGTVTDDPQPESPNRGYIDVFWRNTSDNSNVYWDYYDPNASHGWENASSTLGSGPLGSDCVGVTASAGQVDLFWAGTDQGLWHIWY
ncbi:MAG: PLL family lectin [Candidatus Dormibacteria bacterium]